MLFSIILACSTSSTPSTPPPAPAPAPAPEPEPAPAPTLPTDSDGNTLCPDGRTVYPFWPGEYPSPVLQVDAPFSLQVADTACGAPSRACTVPAGLYHPWAKALPDGAAFGSRTAPTVYTAEAAFTWDGRTVSKGDTVQVRTYLAEGMCAMVVAGNPAEGMCPGTEGNPWAEAPRTAPPDDQILQVPCQGGAPGWVVVDAALQARPEVSEGEMVGFGEVQRR